MSLLRVRMELRDLRQYWMTSAASLVIWILARLVAIRLHPASVDSALDIWVGMVIGLSSFVLLAIGAAAATATFLQMNAGDTLPLYLAQPGERAVLFHEKIAALVLIYAPTWTLLLLSTKFLPLPGKTFAKAFDCVPELLAFTYILSLGLGPFAALLLKQSMAAGLLICVALVASLFAAGLVQAASETPHNILAGIPRFFGLHLFSWIGLGILATASYLAARLLFEKLEVRG